MGRILQFPAARKRQLFRLSALPPSGVTYLSAYRYRRNRLQRAALHIRVLSLPADDGFQDPPQGA